MAAFALSIVVFVFVQMSEAALGRHLFSFPGGTPYDKVLDDGSELDSIRSELDEKKYLEEAVVIKTVEQVGISDEPIGDEVVA